MSSSHIEEKTETLQAMASDLETEDMELQKKMMQLEESHPINMDEFTKVLTCFFFQYMLRFVILVDLINVHINRCGSMLGLRWQVLYNLHPSLVSACLVLSQWFHGIRTQWAGVYHTAEKGRWTR